LENLYWLSRNLEKQVYRPKNISGSVNFMEKQLVQLKNSYIDEVYYAQFEDKIIKDGLATQQAALDLKTLYLKDENNVDLEEQLLGQLIDELQIDLNQPLQWSDKLIKVYLKYYQMSHPQFKNAL